MDSSGPNHRNAGILGGASLCLFVITAYSLSQVQTGTPLPTIRVETKQVLVPVIVKDHKGHYIRNLTAADFRIYDDGTEQKIVAFITQAGGPSSYFRPQGLEGGLALPETLTPSSEYKGLPPNTYIVCLDTLNTAFGDYAQVRHALEKLFRELAPSDARYALVTLGRQAKVVRNLTRDPTAILDALNDRELTGAITQSQTNVRAQEESQLAQMLRRYCGSCDCASGQDPDSGKGSICHAQWEAMEGQVAGLAGQLRLATLDYLNSLQGLVERLGEIPGKRTIIFVSDGFNIQPGRELYGLMAMFTRAQGVLLHDAEQYMEPELQSVVRAAQMRDISFYTLDSRGLYNIFAFDMNQTDIFAAISPLSPFPHPPEHLGETLAKAQSMRQTMADENQWPLQQLATDTGGDFFRNSNDYVKGLRQAFDDGESYYLLAYAPTHLIADGKFHTIKVEVREPSVTTRAKKGYFAPAPEKELHQASTPPAAPLFPSPPAPLPQGGEGSGSRVQGEGALPALTAAPGASTGAATPHAASDAGALSAPVTNPVARPASADRTAHVNPTERAPESQPASVLMVDWPVARLISAIPQLKELKPAESQEPTAEILRNVGRNVGAIAERSINLVSDEKITEEQLRPDGNVSKQFQEKFEYLVVAEAGSNGVTLQEYRTDSRGKPVKPIGLTKGYMVTSGDFSAALCFLPNLQSGSSFRLLGVQNLDGRQTYVIVFAQRPGSSGPVRLVRNATGDRSVTAALQGIAWVDSASYQIARLRTDAFPPPLSTSVWSLISDIHYHEIHLPQLASALWVPDRIVVTMSMADRMWRDEHHYSGFRLFTVESKMSSQPRHQPN